MAWAVALAGCEIVGDIDDRTLAPKPEPEPEAAACVTSVPGASLVAWPDSKTPFCTNGEVAVSCDAASRAHGQDGQYRADVPTYEKFPVPGGAFGVRDDITGLVWEKSGTSPLSWAEAQAHCAGLGEGFHLPSRVELASIVDYGRADAALGEDVFLVPMSMTDLYWTASSPPKVGAAWAVGFREGDVTLLDRGLVARARCVFGAIAAPCFSEGDSRQTVLDARTGLVWQKEASASAATWLDALAHCESLALGGAEDWRLPSIKELASLVSGDGEGSALVPAFFPGSMARIWSSTPSVLSPDAAWYLDGISGSVAHQGTAMTARVRCVR
jgi:hypothetical protein